MIFTTDASAPIHLFGLPALLENDPIVRHSPPAVNAGRLKSWIRKPGDFLPLRRRGAEGLVLESIEHGEIGETKRADTPIEIAAAFVPRLAAFRHYKEVNVAVVDLGLNGNQTGGEVFGVEVVILKG